MPTPQLHRTPARSPLFPGLRPLLGAVLVAGLWLSCSGEKDPVQALLDDVEAAVEDRSAEAVGTHLSQGFVGSRGLQRADALATLRRYLAGYQTVGVEIYGVQIEQAEATASVSLTAEFSGDARKIGGLSGFLPPAALYRFDLEVAVENERWVITSSDWKALPPPDM